jgi:type VI secretion system protein ImpA
VGEKVGAANGPNFSKLVDVLRAAEKIMSARLAQRGVGVESAAAGESGDSAATDGGGGGAPSVGSAISGDIRSREDVMRMLDKLCQYYERYEPSSPIPILLKRSKRLVSATFLDIVRDLAPDGLTQVEVLRGKDETESS